MTQQTLREQARQRWKAFAPRERVMLAAGMAIVFVALLWFVAVAPALRTLRDAPTQIDRLDTQLQRMQRLAAESKGLRAAAPVSTAQAQASLKASTDRLGANAQLQMAGDRATLKINGVTGEALRAWLAEVRIAARARAVDVRLTRSPTGLTGDVVVVLGAAS